MASAQLQSFVDGIDSGSAIVFVHGWPDDHTVFDRQVITLEQSDQGRVCLTLLLHQ